MRRYIGLDVLSHCNPTTTETEEPLAALTA
jgi:hypothetical protein